MFKKRPAEASIGADINPNQDLVTDVMRGGSLEGADAFHAPGTSDNPRSYRGDFKTLHDVSNEDRIDGDDEDMSVEDRLIAQMEPEPEEFDETDVYVNAPDPEFHEDGLLDRPMREWSDDELRDEWDEEDAREGSQLRHAKIYEQHIDRTRGVHADEESDIDGGATVVSPKRNPEDLPVGGNGRYGHRMGKKAKSNRDFYNARLRKFESLERKNDAMRRAFDEAMQAERSKREDIEDIAPAVVELGESLESMQASEADIRAYLDNMITHDIASMSLEEIFGEDVLRKMIDEFGANSRNSELKEAQVRNTWEHVQRHPHLAKGIQKALRLMSETIFAEGKTDDPVEVQKTFLHDILFINPYRNGPLIADTDDGNMARLVVSDALNKGYSRMLMRYNMENSPVQWRLNQKITKIIDSLYRPDADTQYRKEAAE